eukprot:scaffold60059_cov42-Phaeocystis_antarctica.AAC.2
MASASAVVVESTSVWLGLTKTLYGWSDSSLWSRPPKKRRSTAASAAAACTLAESSPLPYRSTRTPSSPAR